MHIREHLKGFILQNILQSFDMHSILQILKKTFLLGVKH